MRAVTECILLRLGVDGLGGKSSCMETDKVVVDCTDKVEVVLVSDANDRAMSSSLNYEVTTLEGKFAKHKRSSS